MDNLIRDIEEIVSTIERNKIDEKNYLLRQFGSKIELLELDKDVAYSCILHQSLKNKTK